MAMIGADTSVFEGLLADDVQIEEDHLVSLESVPADAQPITQYPRWARRYVVVLAGADLVAALLATVICWVLRPSTDQQSVIVLGPAVNYWMLAVLVTPIWLGALALGGAYRRSHAGERLRDYRLPVVTTLRLAGGASITAFALHISLSRLLVLVYFPALLVASLILRTAARLGLAGLRRRGLALRRMLLVGDAACVARFANHLLRSPRKDYRLIGACVPGNARFVRVRGGRLLVVGQPDDLVAAAEVLKADTVSVVGHHHLETTTLQEIAWRVEGSGRDLLVAPDVVDLAGPRIRVGDVGGLPMLHIGDPLIGTHRQTVKACYERAVALVVLLLLSPVFLVVSIAILIGSGRPVLFRQQRVGFKGRLFTMVKFRTMERDADARLAELSERNDHDGALFKMRADPRVTRVGWWLRHFSLDELPQLLNVLKGDMVLVGPRPVLPRETSEFGEAAQRRFLARPGMTGLWQVSGRAEIPWEEGVRLDLYYVENWSLWMDIMIACRTIRVMFTGAGGY